MSADADVAVVGMACRLPGAAGLGQYWANLRAGVESVTVFPAEELRSAGVDRDLLDRPDYVPAAPVLADPSLFDAAFFGYPDHEARILDPQHRLFLECAWAAMDHAGYAPGRETGPVGVYGGSALSSYLLFSGLLPRLRDDYVLTLTANDKDYLATRVSYKLGLTGPSLTVQTACSTSLVAIHLATRALLGGECDMALAGGVSVRVPHRVGYLHDGGHMLSADGHCRPFDARAGGTLFGSGVGVVVLKRLADAVADRDTVHAVVKGTAINNDGGDKAGFSAPSVRGQAAAVVEALGAADTEPTTLSYVEAHGTGTPLGDPIEVEALTRAYRRFTTGRGFCALGSAKSNIGHLDAAAGVAGLIKTVLALRHREIPPTVHFSSPNPHLRLDGTPFTVADRLVPWPQGFGPRRAAVNALGVGGTNAHVILEEAPQPPPPAPARPVVLLPVSARTPAALATAATGLAGHLAGHGDEGLADAAYTLQAGRSSFGCRAFVTGRTAADLAASLSTATPARREPVGPEPPAVVFMFPGQGTQRPGMGGDLYRQEPAFRAAADRCAGLFRAHLGVDVREIVETGDERLARTSITQAALFTVEYALAALWESWGVRPDALIGHSLGELVAACLSGVVGVEDAAALVAVRGRLLEQMPAGVMLAVPLAEERLRSYLVDGLAVAAINAPSQCVVAGAAASVETLARLLAHDDVPSHRLPVVRAFHSPMVEPAVGPFRAYLRGVALRPPRIPFVSNVTGEWIRDDEATSPEYWARHLHRPVRLADGLRALGELGAYVLLETGPGRTLSGLAQQQAGPRAVISALPGDAVPDLDSVVGALGRLWEAGVEPDWAAFSDGGRRRRVPLPGYPFEGRSYWLEPDPGDTLPVAAPPPPAAEPVRAAPAEPATAPATAVEAAVAAVWRSVLGDVPIGPGDNFYRLGGHSLLLTRVAAQLNRVFGIDLPVLTLMEAPTLEVLAARIEDVFRFGGALAAAAQRRPG
jgi:phthiocerol/phenolphthiocerol synthesis type-I polyketide synthase E